uniref:CCHC-type domain-containing protein n=1 Tax=Fagus sylvatica TaxID=28930 RepID=A0A2N9IDE7_FAGSY
MVSEPSMADSSTSNGPQPPPSPQFPSPLMLLSNMSNLMSIKLDSLNYMVWKLQLTTILEAYSMIDHIDGSVQKPSQYLVDSAGILTTGVNPSFLSWKKRDKALLTLIYSTLSPPVLSMVVGLHSAQEVWSTLETRFTSTARANVLNLKLELQSVKKAIRTRDDSLTFEKLSVLLQTEELSINESSELNSSLAMFVSNTNRQTNGSSNYNRGRGRNHYSRGGRGNGRSGNFYPQNQFTQNQSPGSQGQNQSGFHGQNTSGYNKPEHNRPTCQICGKLGHYAIDCYHRMDFAYQGKNPPTKLAAMANASNLNITQGTGETWLTDSGASDHITADLNNLNQPTPFKGPEQVSVGNGQNLPIQNIDHSIPAPPIPPLLPTLSNTHPMQTRSKHGIFKPKPCYTAHLDYALTEPPTFKIVSQLSQWCQAMQDEYDALIKQATWSLVPPPPNHNVVGCKWVYKLKTHSDGSIARYKARLVAKGFHQQQGVDFDETFSLVIKPPTVRMVLSLAVSLHWPLRQLDVSNAFLHGILKEEVYMSQPQGYIDPQHPHYLLQFGFAASTADSSLFIYRTKTTIAYLLLYVDDIVLTSNTPTFLDQLIHHLSSVFDLKDLGPLNYFLGIQVTRDSTGLHLSQAKYATALLHKHQMLHTKPISTPCIPNTRLSLHDGTKLPDPHAYRSLVGALHYLTFTRPDLSFAVHQVCQYMASPTSVHLMAAKRILRYLKGTLHLGISFKPGPLTLSAFTDADWAGDPDDRRSTSGLLVYLGPNPITWSAKKQLTMSRSSTESEYRALALASAQLCWFRTLLKDLGVFISAAPILWCDNISALAIASNPVFHARTKHIEVDFHFVRERVLRKDLAVKFVSTLDQLADIFTKSLPPHRFLDLRSNLMATVHPPELEEGC